MTTRLPAIIFGALILFAIGLAAAGFNPREYARKHGGTMRLSVATGNTGGVYYPYGGGLARVISQSVPNVDATAEVTTDHASAKVAIPDDAIQSVEGKEVEAGKIPAQQDPGDAKPREDMVRLFQFTIDCNYNKPRPEGEDDKSAAAKAK